MLLANGMRTVRLKKKYLMWNTDEIAGFPESIASLLIRPDPRDGLPFAEDYDKPPTVMPTVDPGMVGVAFVQAQNHQSQAMIDAAVKTATAPLMAMIASLGQEVAALKDGGELAPKD